MDAKISEILRGETPKMPKPQGAPVLLKGYQTSGIAAVLQQAFAADSPYGMHEGQLSFLAGYLLSKGKPADALALAKAIAEKNPRSPNSAMLLARAHSAAGNRVDCKPGDNQDIAPANVAACESVSETGIPASQGDCWHGRETLGLQHRVTTHQNPVRHRNNRYLLVVPSLDTVEQGPEIPILTMRIRPRRLLQNPPHAVRRN